MVRIARSLFALLCVVLLLFGSQSSATAKKVQQNGREHTLVIRVLKPSQVLVRINGGLEFSGDLSAGYRSEWSGENIFLAVESGSEVEVSLNGQYFGVFGTSNQPSTLNWPPAATGSSTSGSSTSGLSLELQSSAENQQPVATSTPFVARLSTEIRPLLATTVPATVAPVIVTPVIVAPAPARSSASSFIQIDSEGQRYYIVRSGDVLSGIASDLEVTSEELIQANNISNPGLLSVGTRLYLSTRQAPSASASTSTLNPDSSSNTSVTNTSADNPSVSTTQASEITTTVSVDPNYYTVREGDILSGIAEQFDITVEELSRVNNISEPSLLAVGTQLYLPTSQTVYTSTSDSSSSSSSSSGSSSSGSSSSGSSSSGSSSSDLSLLDLLAPLRTEMDATEISEAAVPDAASTTASVSASPTYYTVKSGEMLSGIALQFDLTTEELIQANDISDPSLISVGTQLFVPTRQTVADSPNISVEQVAETATVGQNYYTVKSGEMLSGIAQQFDLTTEELTAANNITDPSLIAVGTQLYIPSRQDIPESTVVLGVPVSDTATNAPASNIVFGIPALDTATSAPASNIAPGLPASNASVSGSNSANSYTIKAGDTLSSIALQFDLTADELGEANNIIDPSLITVGTELSVPNRQTTSVSTDVSTVETPVESPAVETLAEATVSESQNVNYYTVKPGEMISSIALEYGLTIEELIQANNLVNPSLLAVGTQLILPSPQPVAEPTSSPVPTAVPTLVPTLTPTLVPTAVATLSPTASPSPIPTATVVAVAPASQNYYYIVKPGEILTGIAAKFDISIQELIEANRISNPAMIAVGTRLLLPNYSPSTAAQSADVESENGTSAPRSSTSTGENSSSLITSPNELGSVLVLEYHLIESGIDGAYSRTPESVRADLEWLYANNYYPIKFRDLTEGTIDIPAGKSPVVLAFDDSSIGQFRILDNGEVDPNSAMGIVWDFARSRGDFPPVVTAFPLLDVDMPSRILWGQPELADRKLQMIVELGGEIGSHTVSHEQLDKVSEARIQWQLAYSAKWLEDRIGNGYKVRSLALPLGLYPNNEALLRSGSSEGISYAYTGAAEVAGGPAFSPYSVNHNPYRIRRAQAVPGYIDAIYLLLESQQTLKYISDGDPQTITIPSEATLDQEQRSTFSEAAWPEYRVVRYER